MKNPRQTLKTQINFGFSLRQRCAPERAKAQRAAAVRSSGG
jgi:hypothetical protein